MNFDAALLVFALCLLAAHRGAAQMLVARLSERLGHSLVLLVIALFTALLTGALAALAGAWLASFVFGFERALLAASALVLAGIALALRRPLSLPEEPTRSYGAITLALAAKQMVDAPRLVIFAGAAALASPWNSWTGGGLATSLSILFGWALAERTLHATQWLWLRYATASILLFIAALIVWIGYTQGN